MADRSRPPGPGGAFDPNQYKTFYFVLLLAIAFTVKDIYLSETPAGERGKMSSESGSEESDGGMGDSNNVRQRLFENDGSSNEGNIKKSAAGSMLSAGKLNGPSIKFMYCTS